MVLRAITGAFVQHWQLTARPGEFAFNALNQLATVAVIAWLARISDRGDVVAAIAVGVIFMVVWRATVFQVGGLVSSSFNQGVLEMEMMSPAPILLVMLGKTMAALAFYGIVGVCGFWLVLWVAGAELAIAAPLLLVPGLLVTVAAVVSTAFLFAPLNFVLGGRAGFFNAIIPAGIVMSGFVQPISLLPPVIEVPARVLATAWAMEGLRIAIEGGAVGDAWSKWAVASALSVATLAASAWLFVRAERRVRDSGGQ